VPGVGTVQLNQAQTFICGDLSLPASCGGELAQIPAQELGEQRAGCAGAGCGSGASQRRGFALCLLQTPQGCRGCSELLQPSRGLLSLPQSKLALQKHLTKALATRFLPSQLTTAVCALPGPLALRPAAATTLFQAPILGPALFRTPPAHVRTTPGPIIFAPY